MSPRYAHLGFDPAPGDVEAVFTLQKKLTDTTGALGETYRMITSLRSNVSWKGDAAVAFKEQIDGAFPDNLRKAYDSLAKAAVHLDSWRKDLAGYQEQARALDGRAKAAKDKLEKAKAREKEASAHPDLDLAGKQFDTDAELNSAQTRLNAATKSLNDARTAVNDAQDDLDAVLKKARELEETHGSTARKTARDMRDAAEKLAPDEPGWFETALDWIVDNRTDILGAIAAIAGLLALICSGPFGIAMLLVAAVASAATLASRLSDPKVRESLKDGFTKGEFDADFWSNSVGAAGDILGAVPGLGAVTRGAKGAFAVTDAAADSATLGQKIINFGPETWQGAKDVSQLKNPLTTWIVRGAGGGQKMTDTIDITVAGAGTLTATYGVAKNIFEEIQNPTAENVGVGMDATRAVTFDGAGHGSTMLKTLQVLFK
ncbi:hypothetical protein ACFW9F_03360 [Streptomyces sp. NPDC059506]|uniref:hypothetical protein n=1 Tax=unclassified Streptomyces TaxID=2593676 RepID=UPI000CBF9A32|nr:hypothetical protein [Streptomyces sp. SCUT-3]PLW71731.1 hypothetical protein C0036_16295 [Streptomyces sp. DJ]QMV22064.1 hypothetical protein GQS52_10025 [Streptomyces sp. SCUT-3]